MSCGKCLHHTFSWAFVLGLFVVAAVAVPTSVLVQNSEVTSNIKAANNGHNLMSKVKRSSTDINEMMHKETINDESSTSANKKSSPEVLPPAFNVPTNQQQDSRSSGKDGTDFNSNSIAYGQSAGMDSMPSNEDIINSAIAAGLTAAAVQAAAASSQRDLEQQSLTQQAQVYGDKTPTVLQKRGISNPQYLYGAIGMGGPYGSASGSSGSNSIYGSGEYYNNAYLANPIQVGGGSELERVPTGFWADEMDPSVVYTDVQDEDFLGGPRASSYHSKAYDNLQNILNVEAHPVPQTLHSRYYGANNGNKRANRYDNNNNNNNNGVVSGSSARFADMRLKRDTKLTPADMLALVALVEAGERARKDPETETNNGYVYPSNPAPPEGYNTYSGIKTYYPVSAGAYDYPTNMDAINNGGSWLEPNMIDYYGLPANVETIPKYELQREQKYGAALTSGNGNRYGIKRFMVSKKKRSMGNFLNEPIAKPSISYNANNEKFY